MTGKSYELPDDITTMGGMVTWADKDAEWHTEVFEFLADARYSFRAHVHAGDAAGEFLSPGHLAQRHLHVGLARRQPQLAEQHVFEPRRVAPVGHGNLVAVVAALGRLQRQRKSPLAVRAAPRREDLPSAPGQLQLQRRAGLRPAAHLHPRALLKQRAVGKHILESNHCIPSSVLFLCRLPVSGISMFPLYSVRIFLSSENAALGDFLSCG